MGTKFFQGAGPRFQPSELNMMARANNAPTYAARGASIGAQKDLAAADALVKAHKPKKTQGSSAYPKVSFKA